MAFENFFFAFVTADSCGYVTLSKACNIFKLKFCNNQALTNSWPSTDHRNQIYKECSWELVHVLIAKTVVGAIIRCKTGALLASTLFFLSTLWFDFNK